MKSLEDNPHEFPLLIEIRIPAILENELHEAIDEDRLDRYDETKLKYNQKVWCYKADMQDKKFKDKIKMIVLNKTMQQIELAIHRSVTQEEYEFLEEAFDIFYWGHYEKNKTHCTFEKLSEIYCMGYPYDMSEKPIKTKQKRLKISIIKKIEKLYQRNTRKNKKLSKKQKKQITTHLVDVVFPERYEPMEKFSENEEQYFLDLEKEDADEEQISEEKTNQLKAVSEIMYFEQKEILAYNHFAQTPDFVELKNQIFKEFKQKIDPIYDRVIYSFVFRNLDWIQKMINRKKDHSLYVAWMEKDHPQLKVSLESLCDSDSL